MLTFEQVHLSRKNYTAANKICEVKTCSYVTGLSLTYSQMAQLQLLMILLLDQTDCIASF